MIARTSQINRCFGVAAAIIVCLALVGTTFAGQILYVDADAIGVHNGSTWADAYNYLQDALAGADSGDQIHVAQGVYTPDSNSNSPNGSGHRQATFQLKNGVTITGGYAGFGESDPDAHDVESYQTILSGDLDGNDVGFANNAENSYHVVTGSGTNATAVLDGFIITAGNANSAIDPDYRGGGMYNESGSPMLVNCLFKSNSASFGGGMINDSSSPRLVNCIFVSNSSTSQGGGIHNRNSSSPILINCIFTDNFANSRGGGIRNGGSNCDPKLTNCTFNGNSTGGDGGGIYSWGSGPILTNCIFWGNRDSGGSDESAQIYDGSTGTPVVNNSCIQGWTGTLGGVGNIGIDPSFVDSSNGDYHLKSHAGRWHTNSESWVTDSSTSPCIDAGDPNSNWTAELWPHGMCINMGAFGGTKQASMSLSNAGNIADLNINGFVNCTDLILFTDKWLHQEVLLSEDLNRNGFVNFGDFAVFANEWLWEGQGWEPGDSEAVSELRRLINEDYSYWQLRGVDWDNLFDIYSPAMNEAQTPEEFAELAAELLAYAEDAHVRLYIGNQYFTVFRRSVEQNYNLNVLSTLVPGWQNRNNRVSTGYFADGIGYIWINSWTRHNPEQLEAIFEALEEYAGTYGLIIDVRANSGGRENFAEQVAGCFVTESKVYAKHRNRDISQPDEFSEIYERELDPNPSHPRYTGRVVVLMGQVCMSSCDAFLLMMKQVSDCTLIGVNSYGSSGNPKSHNLPNGVTVDLPSWLALRPDETCFEGEGIFPHITVEATQEQLLTHDPILEAALELLREP